MESFQRVRDWFWSESFWLPTPTTWSRRVTWNDFKSTDQIRVPQSNDLYAVIPLIFVIILMRVVFERFIASPILIWCGLKERPVQKVEPNEILEKVYNNLTGQLEGKDVKSLASRLGWTVKRVEKWFRYKSNYDKPSKLKKAKESCWRSLFYIGAYIWGVSALKKEKYLYDTRYFWIGYPDHNLSDGIYCYYMVQLAFYVGLLLSQFTDVKRKDFWIQSIHHVVTISLLVFSYVNNFVPIGAVILLVHDVADIVLEVGKVCKYIKLQKLCDVIFGIFAVVFFVSRLVVFPTWILRSVWVEFPLLFREIMPVYYCFMALLLTLQVMHIFWFYLISRMAYGFLVTGKVDNDTRSETEETEDEEEEDKNGFVKNGLINNKSKMS